ncbi:valine--tRNA ligase [archaeon]|jgi:valyl-tRNA synthetase|nr:valine--tRNA ligase [archaeon]MBT6824182.1 valine--tRNA ligase [archaeon]MBT7106974.1 valine--tRNA ligase [archaeon]MBT7297586.1 valine--tRNA ligase [archaeon]
MKLPKKYDFKVSEKKWDEFWKEEGIYKFDPKSKKEIYSVDTPPPTVSGDMHIGHAFSYSQQDFLVRYHRMNGKNVFFPFGTDDNGLPTEKLIERLKGVRHNSMTKSEFVKLCQKTVKEVKPDFIQDWKNIGMSCDFDTTYSTIDDHSMKTSQKSFIDLYKKKLVKLKTAPTMWCVNCKTAIAQAELEDKNFKSSFNDIVFKVDGKDLVVSTTRPELIPACVCIYVNPEDKKYKKIIGKSAKVPLFDYEVPIFADESADPEKGTGVLMICSYGDKYDVEAITKRDLDPRIVLTKEGKMNDLANPYSGLKLKEARMKILEDLEKEKLLVDKKSIEHAVNVHDKCGTEIEFLASKQWFIEVLKNKTKLIKAADKINWYPGFMKTRYVNWVKNLSWDWGISRQRFYGIPFPLWYCEDCGSEIIADEKQLPVDPFKDKPLKKCSCGSDNFVPEPDVMDTWATSSLTPQIVLNWAENESEDYKDVKFEKMYPMSLRPQAHDIIRTWAFYTIVKGIYNCGEIPWKDVAISGFVLDPNKEKMSKSKGNVVNPREILDKYGADAMRFWASGSSLGKDYSYLEDDVMTGVKMINKLWNASKFSIMHLEDFDNKPVKLDSIDKGILSKFNNMVKEVHEFFENYEYSKAKSLAESFFWNQICDNYLEIAKDRLYNPDSRGDSSRRSAQYTLRYLILNSLKLFAPIMPYITEEIYHLYKFEDFESIHVSEFSKYDKNLKDEHNEGVWDRFVEIITEIRQTKAKHNKSLKAEISLTLCADDESLLRDSLGDLKSVSCAKDIEIGSKLRVLF